MGILRNNIVANFGGQALSVILALAFMPVYVRILGIEAYGLIGLFLSLQALFTILDMGLSATLNRELARYSHTGAEPDQQRDLVRTMECLYWPMGLIIIATIAMMSQPIAQFWLKPESITVAQASHAIVLMGVAVALQWPTSLYAGGFRGLERQVELNSLNSAIAALRTLGSVGILLYISPTLVAFLWWQVAVGALQTAMSSLLLWRMLPAGTRAPVFRPSIVREVRGFTLGLSAVAALSFMLAQSDRIILSNLLPLTQFGYYAFAATVASVLSSLIGPFFNALYPRFSGLVGAGRHAELSHVYHFSNQILAVVVSSVASVLSFFSVDVLTFWTHDSELARQSGPILSFLVIGTALHGLLHLPYALQLAYGWTRLAFYQNVVSVVVIVPTIWWLAHLYGALGAASAWIMLNLAWILVSIPLMHRRLLPGEMSAWYLQDILPAVGAAVGCAGIAKAMLPSLPTGFSGIASLSLIGLSTLCTAAFASPACRSILINGLKRLKPRQ